jgi:chromosome segregation ATPase
MAKKATANDITSSPDQVKGRKKQAKREARLMLKLEQAKKALGKAEQKVAKAQSNLEARTERLHKIENRLAELRAEQNGSVGATAPEISVADQEQTLTAVTVEEIITPVNDTGGTAPEAEAASAPSEETQAATTSAPVGEEDEPSAAPQDVETAEGVQDTMEHLFEPAIAREEAASEEQGATGGEPASSQNESEQGANSDEPASTQNENEQGEASPLPPDDNAWRWQSKEDGES